MSVTSFPSFLPLSLSYLLLQVSSLLTSALCSLYLCSGCSPFPPGRLDNMSDSSHSEISSRSSVCSVDSVPPLGAEERCGPGSRACAPTASATPAATVESAASAASHSNADFSQPSSRWRSSLCLLPFVSIYVVVHSKCRLATRI